MAISTCSGQSLWLRLWGVVMMLSGIALISVNVAFVADVLLSRRLSQAANRRLVSHLRDHLVVVGLGSFGVRVAGILKTPGTVTAIERKRGQPVPRGRRRKSRSSSATRRCPRTLAAAGADRQRGCSP